VAEALRRVPGSAPARYQAALLAFGAGNAAALHESAGVLGARGGPAIAAELAARSAELAGTLEDADQAYAARAALSDRDPGALLALGGALARLRASGPALKLAARALRRDPLEARLHRAPTDFWEGPAPLAEAARRFAEIGRSEPRSAATAWAAAAACELLLGHTQAADGLARAAAAASPQASTPLVLLAQVALERGQARAALPLARAAVEARPDDAAAQEQHARVLEALGRNDDAERAHRAALDAAPDLATARLALARLLSRRGDAAGARDTLAELVKESPGMGPARGALLALDEAAPAPHPKP
jgi:tetratricopeptide (TPR) repeat protein